MLTISYILHYDEEDNIGFKSGVGNWGSEGHLWPFAHFSMALLMLMMSKNCYIHSDWHSSL